MTKGLTHERAYQGLTNEWYTPKYIIDALGEFDLDPCAAPKDQRPFETAKLSYDITDDGLKQDWNGRVWLNPPYGSEAKLWLKRMAEHNNGIVLIFARTETRYFFDFCWKRAKSFLFLEGRIKFISPNKQKLEPATAPSVLIAYDDENLTNTNILRNCQLDGHFIMNH